MIRNSNGRSTSTQIAHRLDEHTMHACCSRTHRTHRTHVTFESTNNKYWMLQWAFLWWESISTNCAHLKQSRFIPQKEKENTISITTLTRCTPVLTRLIREHVCTTESIQARENTRSTAYFYIFALFYTHYSREKFHCTYKNIWYNADAARKI